MKNLLDYIKGKRKGKFAHDIEKTAMQDPFLDDALEGYDSVVGNHIKSIEQLQAQILKKTEKKKSYTSYLYIAASILVIFFTSAYFLLYNSKKEDTTIAYRPIQKEKISPAIVNEYDEHSSLRKEEIIKNETNVSKHKSSHTSKTHAKTDEKYTKQNVETPSIAFEDNSKYYLENPLSAEGMSQKDVTIRTSPYLARNYLKNEKANNELFDDLSIDNKGDSTILEPQQEEEKLLAINSKNKKWKSNEILSRKALSADKVIYDGTPVIGKESYNQYLRDHILLLKEDKCYNVNGDLLIVFPISESGRPHNLKIIKSLCPELDLKVMELITNGADWKGIQGEVQFSR